MKEHDADESYAANRAHVVKGMVRNCRRPEAVCGLFFSKSRWIRCDRRQIGKQFVH